MSVKTQNKQSGDITPLLLYNARAAQNVATQKYIQVKTKQKIKAKTWEYKGEWTESPGTKHGRFTGTGFLKRCTNAPSYPHIGHKRGVIQTKKGHGETKSLSPCNAFFVSTKLGKCNH